MLRAGPLLLALIFLALLAIWLVPSVELTPETVSLLVAVALGALGAFVLDAAELIARRRSLASVHLGPLLIGMSIQAVLGGLGVLVVRMFLDGQGFTDHSIAAFFVGMATSALFQRLATSVSRRQMSAEVE